MKPNLRTLEKELASLKRVYPHHEWVYEDYVIRCKKCGTSEATPDIKCESFWLRAVKSEAEAIEKFYKEEAFRPFKKDEK